MDATLLAKVRSSRLANAEQLLQLGKDLRRALPKSVRIVQRGFFGRGRFRSMSVLVDSTLFRAEMFGGAPHFYVGTAVRGIASLSSEVPEAQWRAKLDESLSAL